MLKEIFHWGTILIGLCVGLYGMIFFLSPFFGQPWAGIELGVCNPDGTLNFTLQGYWGVMKIFGIFLGGYVGFWYFLREVGPLLLEMYRRC